MRFILRDKATSLMVDEDYIYNIYIGLDGKPYEVSAACMGGDTWLDTEDVSDKYSVYLVGVDVSID
jgi:hypothetical protein